VAKRDEVMRNVVDSARARIASRKRNSGQKLLTSAAAEETSKMETD